VNFYWNIADGPVVVEIPSSADGVGIFDTTLDSWQRPIDYVGAAGRDGGSSPAIPAHFHVMRKIYKEFVNCC
jgi:hypothetical protein